MMVVIFMINAVVFKCYPFCRSVIAFHLQWTSAMYWQLIQSDVVVLWSLAVQSTYLVIQCTQRHMNCISDRALTGVKIC